MQIPEPSLVKIQFYCQLFKRKAGNKYTIVRNKNYTLAAKLIYDISYRPPISFVTELLCNYRYSVYTFLKNMEVTEMRKSAIHIGLNFVNPARYSGWNGALRSCEKDARDMRDITLANGFNITTLLTPQATSIKFFDYLSKEAEIMRAGDKLIFTFAGHGASILDKNGDEDDHRDEALVFYDRLVLDDEIHNALSAFRPGVKVFMVVDSCYSGTVTRMVGTENQNIRFIPSNFAVENFRQNYKYYQREISRARNTSLGCSVILLAAAKDSQVAIDGESNGLFTSSLKEIWNKGKCQDNNRTFIQRIKRIMPRFQTPGLLALGPDAQQLELARPFFY